MNKIADIEKPKPLLILDGWRGLAVLWVVMFHAICPFMNTPGKLIYCTNPLYQMSSLGDIGVTLFFVISGYCITGALCNVLGKNNCLSAYITGRIKRIYPPYFVALVFYSAASLLTIFLAKHFFTIKHPPSLNLDWFFWFSNLGLIQHEFKQPSIVPVAWSLCYEIAFYAVFGIILSGICMIKKVSASIRTCHLLLSFVIFLISLFSIAWLMFSPGTCPFPFQLWYQFGIGSLFYMSSLTYHKKPNGLKSIILDSRFQLIISLALILLYGCLHEKIFSRMTAENGSIDGHAASPVQPFVTALFMVVLLLMKPFDAKVAEVFLFQLFMRLGVISYSVYLIHTLIQPFIDAGLRHLGFDNSWYFPNYFLQIVIPIAFAIPFYALVEKRCLSTRRLQIMDEEKSLVLSPSRTNASGISQ
jgi:peptidoglycan/LPS O-acetylase OafA/YrhL